MKKKKKKTSQALNETEIPIFFINYKSKATKILDFFVFCSFSSFFLNRPWRFIPINLFKV